uniref:PAN domain protein n=1 Tax=Syphacia muris TaxID=451379 RepID=A0A0N5AUH4_9BILA
MELFYLSPSQCIDHCILALSTNLPNFETCQSFVYDHRRHSCKLFSHDGFKPPAIVHPANGYDLYRRILSANNCGGYYNLNFLCIVSQWKNKLPVLKNLFLFSVIFELSYLEAGDQCKTSIAYYVVIGNEIIFPISSAETDVRTINGVKHTECFKLCTANKDSDGEQLKCSSVNYFPKEKKCEMHEILAEPHGPGSLVENDQAIYAEKFCLPTQSVICEENEVFILHVQKKIVKNELRIKQSNSITNCLRHCLEHRFCQTAVLDSVHHRCMLYDVKLKNNDDVTDADSGWVLIENGCSVKKNQKLSLNLEKKIKQSAETEWTEWSNCQFKLRGRMVKVRTRDCPDGGMQVQRC